MIMTIDRELLDALAGLLEYPEHDWIDRLDACERVAAVSVESVAAPFLAFREATSMSVDALQEGYVRIFELSTDCTLECGFHLFGETYKRGEFLASLREEEQPYDIGQERQLPDYLPVLLRLIGRLDDDELRRDLIGACVLPAVEKLQTTLATKEGPYGALMTAVAGALEDLLRREIEAAPDAVVAPEATIAAGTEGEPRTDGASDAGAETTFTCSGATAPGCAIEHGHA